MAETTYDESGWLWIREHTKFAHGVLDALGSFGDGSEQADGV
jgi:hypothetical protein